MRRRFSAVGLAWVLVIVNAIALGSAIARPSDGGASRPLVPHTGMPAGVLGQRAALRTGTAPPLLPI